MIIIHIRREIKHFLNFFQKNISGPLMGKYRYFSMLSGFLCEEAWSKRGASREKTGDFSAIFSARKVTEGIFRAFLPVFAPSGGNLGGNGRKRFYPFRAFFLSGFPSTAVCLTAGTPRPAQSERISRAARPPFDSRISPQLLIFFAFRKN